MEPWLMECFGFYCVAIGVGVIVYLCVKAFLYLAHYQENTYLKELEKTVKERDEQIQGLRSTIDKLKNELRESHDSYDSLLSENNRLNYELCALERENKK